MYNWSVDEKAFKKADPAGYERWRLEQLINYGEAGEKLPAQLIKRRWPKIQQNIDPAYRAYLAFLLWPQKQKVS